MEGIGYRCIPTDFKLMSRIRILGCGTSTDGLNNSVYISGNYVLTKWKCMVDGFLTDSRLHRN